MHHVASYLCPSFLFVLSGVPHISMGTALHNWCVQDFISRLIVVVLLPLLIFLVVFISSTISAFYDMSSESIWLLDLITSVINSSASYVSLLFTPLRNYFSFRVSGLPLTCIPLPWMISYFYEVSVLISETMSWNLSISSRLFPCMSIIKNIDEIMWCLIVGWIPWR